MIGATPFTGPRTCEESWALFDVYLGDHPISKSGKKSVIARFSRAIGRSAGGADSVRQLDRRQRPSTTIVV